MESYLTGVLVQISDKSYCKVKYSSLYLLAYLKYIFLITIILMSRFITLSTKFQGIISGPIYLHMCVFYAQVPTFIKRTCTQRKSWNQSLVFVAQTRVHQFTYTVVWQSQTQSIFWNWADVIFLSEYVVQIGAAENNCYVSKAWGSQENLKSKPIGQTAGSSMKASNNSSS